MIFRWFFCYFIRFTPFLLSKQCKKSLAAQCPGCYGQADNEKENYITCNKFLFTAWKKSEINQVAFYRSWCGGKYVIWNCIYISPTKVIFFVWVFPHTNKQFPWISNDWGCGGEMAGGNVPHHTNSQTQIDALFNISGSRTNRCETGDPRPTQSSLLFLWMYLTLHRSYISVWSWSLHPEQLIRRPETPCVSALTIDLVCFRLRLMRAFK